MPPQQTIPAQPITPGLTYINPFASAQRPSLRTVPTIQANLPTAPTLLTDKPFSNYRAPAPVSPYLNLYRSNNSFGAVNDYYTLVRPLLEQQIYNQQIQKEVQSLQSATQMQSQSLQHLDQRTDQLFGFPPSGSYMNFQNYFPGFQPSVR